MALMEPRQTARHKIIRSVPASDFHPGLLGAWLSSGTSTAAMPAALLEATVRACLGFAGRQAISTALASATAVALARGVLDTMTISKLKTLGASALACVFPGRRTDLRLPVRRHRWGHDPEADRGRVRCRRPTHRPGPLG